jgi:hypothetical protein
LKTGGTTSGFLRWEKIFATMGKYPNFFPMAEAQKTPDAPKTPESTGAAPKAEKSFFDRFKDTVLQTEATEAKSKAMNEIIAKQKKELADVVARYQADAADVVGQSGKSKAALLEDVRTTIQTMQLETIPGLGSSERKGVTIDAYEKLEAKITGTNETAGMSVDALTPEFITKAIQNLSEFERALAAVEKNKGPVIVNTAKPTPVDTSTISPTINEKQENKEASKTKLRLSGKDVEIADKAELYPAKDGVNFRVLEGKDGENLEEAGRIDPKKPLLYDASRPTETMFFENTKKTVPMIPVIYDGKAGYVAASLLKVKVNQHEKPVTAAEVGKDGKKDAAKTAEKAAQSDKINIANIPNYTMKVDGVSCKPKFTTGSITTGSGADTCTVAFDSKDGKILAAAGRGKKLDAKVVGNEIILSSKKS